MQIKQFRYAADNFGYLVFGQTEALAVDGGAVAEMLTFLEKEKRVLKYVTHTHSHPDHTTGTGELTDRSGAAYVDHRKLIDTERIEVDGVAVDVLHTPGHTDDSVTFSVGGALITGDTLFNGTVGNCFSGNLDGFYHSIRTLVRFPADTVVYAGHDYVKEAMAFARSVEPGNRAIERFLATYDPGHVFSTLADEMAVNPYLRFNESPVIEVLKGKGLAVDTEIDRWRSVMTLE